MPDCDLAASQVCARHDFSETISGAQGSLGTMPGANPPSPTVRLLAWATWLGIACFGLAMAALHRLQPGLSPFDEAMSYYVHGPHGWLLTLGLLTLGLGSSALTIALGGRPGAAVGRAGIWCLGIWSAGVLLGAIFAADPPGQWDGPPSVSGSIHGLAAMVALIIFPVGAVLVSRRLCVGAGPAKHSGTLRVLAIASAVSLVVFMSSLVPVFVRPGPPVLLGLTERILFLVYISWLGVAAAATYQHRAAGTGDIVASPKVSTAFPSRHS